MRGDGRVLLYKRTELKKPKWQARIRIPYETGYKIVSTKTADLREAERFALNLYDDLCVHVRGGGTMRSRTFKQVHDEWQTQVAKVGKTRRGGSWSATAERIGSYALSFFGPKKIDRIGVREFTEYWEWRRSNYARREPTNETLRRERTSILAVFKFAVSKGYIGKVPDTNPPPSKGGRRPTFSHDEWKRIRDSSIAWVKEGKELAVWRDRFIAQHYFLILANTGLRTGELRELRWRDLRRVKQRGSDGHYLTGEARGKTGTRQFVCQPGTEVSFQKLYEHRCKELAKQRPDEEDPKPDADERVFCHPNGAPIASFKNSFASLLKFAGVPAEKDEGVRTPYSLRHYYATRQLSKEANPFLLAKQMGTSVEMLEQHYGQVVTTSLAAQITKAEPSNLRVKSTTGFPFLPH